MEKYQGLDVSSGIALGRIQVFEGDHGLTMPRYHEDVEAELERVEEARIQAMEQLTVVHDRAVADLGNEEAALFEIHKMMLEDQDFVDDIHRRIISQRLKAEYAVEESGEAFVRSLSWIEEMDADIAGNVGIELPGEDPNPKWGGKGVRGRRGDVEDVIRRLVANLRGRDLGAMPDAEEDVILVAEDLTSEQVYQLDRSRVKALAIGGGSVGCHGAILARTMKLPAVMGLGAHAWSEFQGRQAIVDGNSGLLILSPDEETVKDYRARCVAAQSRRARYQQLLGKENRTLDGKEIALLANVEGLKEAEEALYNDCGGIGLFRTEFLYMGAEYFPSEEVQFDIYRKLMSRMSGKRVVIRTLDLGGDKQASCLKLPSEVNPAMGCRGFRLYQQYPALLKTQLRALFRAGCYGQLWVLFPMISSPDELLLLQELAEEARKELRRSWTPFSDRVPLGVMIETPAAVLMSAELAKRADFLSLGTNDLTQYTLAMDRRNPSLSRRCDLRHPAVLQLIQMTAKAARSEGKWLEVCGDLAADPEMTAFFIRNGIRALSVPPDEILPLRKEIREMRIGT